MASTMASPVARSPPGKTLVAPLTVRRQSRVANRLEPFSDDLPERFDHVLVGRRRSVSVQRVS
jgi:hypothetical protein